MDPGRQLPLAVQFGQHSPTLANRQMSPLTFAPIENVPAFPRTLKTSRQIDATLSTSDDYGERMFESIVFGRDSLADVSSPGEFAECLLYCRLCTRLSITAVLLAWRGYADLIHCLAWSRPGILQ